MKKGDEVTLAGVIIDVTESGNAIVQIKGSGRFLIKAESIKTLCPAIEIPNEDKRKGN